MMMMMMMMMMIIIINIIINKTVGCQKRSLFQFYVLLISLIERNWKEFED